MKVYRNDLGYTSSLRLLRDLFLEGLTPRRVANALLMGLDYTFGRERPWSRPIGAKFETANLCNLRCPGCLHGEDPRGAAFRSKRYMTPEVFGTLLDGLWRDAFIMFLYHKGEPFLNPALLDLCEAARSRRVATVVSSNFSLPFSDAQIEAIALRGPRYLTVSCDGLSQEVYERYRVGGRVETVLANMRRLVEARRQSGTPSSTLAWQFIVFDHNRHELDAAMDKAREIGVDQFVVTRDAGDICRDGHALGTGQAGLMPDPFPFKCRWLWSMPVFLYDGEMTACCNYDWSVERHLGNAVEHSVQSLWQGENYALNRRLVTGKERCADHAQAFCSRCPLSRPDF